MKESIYLLSTLIIFVVVFKIINSIYPISLDILINLIIVFSFATTFLKFSKKNKKNKKNISTKLIKKSFLEFNIFMMVSALYSYFMAVFFNQAIFYYYYELVSFGFLFFNIIYFYLINIGYKDCSEILFYDFNNIKILMLKSLVKIFFIPFIYGSVYICLNNILLISDFSWLKLDYYFYLIGLTFDVYVALFGYIFTTQLLNNRILSVDDSVRGWLICLICYPPFLFIYQILLRQVDSYTWSNWAKGQWFYYPWLILIVFFWILYWLSHAHFGFKFSNLTWRGLVDNGLYKYFKHPAYLSKNIYWWLYTVPFYGVYFFDFFINICVLIIISLIYYFRAKTEEMHLMRFKEYREYSSWVDENGCLPKLKKMLMFFK